MVKTSYFHLTQPEDLIMGCNQSCLRNKSAAVAAVPEEKQSSDKEIPPQSPPPETTTDAATPMGTTDSDDDGDGGSDDSEEEDYYDSKQFKTMLDNLLSRLTYGEDSMSSQLVALTELCDMLSYSPENSIRSKLLEPFFPVLIAMSIQETTTSPDIMLFAIRAISYACDASPSSVPVLVQHGAVVSLCAPLLAIEYLDVAEQCLQALEKISRRHPRPCLEAGAIMTILNYIDFFSSSVQRVGITIIANVCKKLPSECSPQVVEAVPLLCNLLYYEDQKLVQNVATCLIWIVKKVSHSPEMLDEVCKQGLTQQVAHLIASNVGNILNQQIYTGLIELLSQLASGSITASNSLLELNISNTMKQILSTYDLSHSKPQSLIHEVIKLLYVLLPPLSTDGDGNMKVSNTDRIIAHQPGLLQQFGADVLPVLVQIVNNGANMHICYGCLSVVNKIVHFSTANMLVDLLNSSKISSFLAGVIARKDLHLLMLALTIVKNVMQELPDAFFDSFIKEGVVYTIDALITPQDCPQFKLQTSEGAQRLSKSNQNMPGNDSVGCLCYVYVDQSSENESCKLEETSAHTLAKYIRTTYFTTKSGDSELKSTTVLKKLRNLCAVLSDKVNMSVRSDNGEQEKNLTYTLGQIMEVLSGEEPVSTFEFIESGIVRSLVDYLSNGCYRNREVDSNELSNHLLVLQKRYEVFAKFCLSSPSHHQKDKPLGILLGKLQSALSLLENFPVVFSHVPEPEGTYATIPFERTTFRPCLKVRFIKEEGEESLCDYVSDVVSIEAFTFINAIERYLWPKVKHEAESATEECAATTEFLKSSSDPKKLLFYLGKGHLDRTLSLYQAILQLKMETENDPSVGASFWNQVYEIKYSKDTGQKKINIHDGHHNSGNSREWSHPQIYLQNAMCVSSMLFADSPLTLKKSSPIYEILSLLKILEVLNKSASHLVSHERIASFAEGCDDSLDNLIVSVCGVPPSEFVNVKLTGKLEQQMQDASLVSTGSMPSWFVQLMEAFPFLFGFETRRKYFLLTLGNSSKVQSNNIDDRQSHASGSPRKKFKVCRRRILESAAQVMGSHVGCKAILEVEYPEEVGTGQGPTMEFFTLVSQEFQKVGMGMWRGDHKLTSTSNSEVDSSGFVVAPLGLFPRPWSASSSPNETQLSEVIKKFVLLGQLVAKALQDGRVLDVSLSSSFYKLILEQDLNLYDIFSFDHGIGRALVEFQALVDRKKVLDLIPVKKSDSYILNTRIEDLCLDFTLPGYPDYKLASVDGHEMVNMSNLQEYVSSILDATVNSGICRQVEAFKLGFSQVLPLNSLKIFTAEELDQLICGEQNAWNYNELGHIKFDHGYTISSPTIVKLLEIMQEFEYNQRRAFLQFVTGAPRLPPGGFAALNPKLTIVCKPCNGGDDGDLPSVMTCANYLKLPPYSSKEIMKERLLYAITEGQGSFLLS
ncbi:E3 ubiquitin-protein ligase upl4 [Thalictrum thalictroides]|uniref:HECT-type E3 ubiquitin transferase n=1 Tax=Thalictrum thalictroides TaxID=46969 RepID=A0A7J6WXI3_THATH|nr:E3 ubiquitin-protein ligase upl4 [Thalictrum thalictroides]